MEEKIVYNRVVSGRSRKVFWEKEKDMKKTGKITWILLILAAFILGTPVRAKAENYNIQANGQWVDGRIVTAGQSNFYKVTLSKPGRLTLSYQAWSIDDSYCVLMNNDMTVTYEDFSIWDATATNPKTQTVTNWMEAGTYTIKVYGYGNDDVGDYKLVLQHRAAGNNEKEPNNAFQNAMPLNANTWVSGLISRDDRLDFYRVNVPVKTNIMISYLSYFDDSYVELWNSDFLSVEKKAVWNGSEETPQTMTMEYTCNPGVYYIKVSPDWSDDQGRYSIRFQFLTKVSNITIKGNKTVTPGKSFQLRASVAPVSATNKTIKWRSESSYIAEVNENTGLVKTHRAGSTVITATAQDGSEVLAKVTVTVKPGKTTGLKVRRYSSYYYRNYAYAAWTSQSGVSGYQVQYSASKSFKKAKKTNSSYASCTIRKLIRGKKYYVRVRSYVKIKNKKIYGEWSKAKSIRL